MDVSKWTLPISTTAPTAFIDRIPPTFCADPHGYWRGSVQYPSVTTIIKTVIPVSYAGATEWHMQRGTVVHECCALACRGVRFECDPVVTGQVAACREWLSMRNPAVASVERMVWRDEPIAYAGTLDLLCMIGGELWIVDWKSTASPWCQWQLGGYADALDADGITARYGRIVTLGEDGKCKEGEKIDLKRARNEWRSILGVYAQRDHIGQCARNVETMIKREGIK